jgi:hypothetical protein
MGIKSFESAAMISSLFITPSPERGRGNGSETRPGIEPKEGAIPNLPTSTRTLTLSERGRRSGL